MEKNMYDMTVYLVRHGETDLNKQKRIQGQTNTQLNAYGEELARITGQALKDVPIEYVYSSPLDRAVETAKLLLQGRDIPIWKDERIQEISFGIYEGLSYHPEHYNIPDDTFMNFFQAPAAYNVPEGGESFAEVIERTSSFWKEITESPSHKNKTLLVSTHGCALKAILANIRHTPLEEFWGEGVHKNCAVTIIKIKDGTCSIEEAKIFY